MHSLYAIFMTFPLFVIALQLVGTDLRTDPRTDADNPFSDHAFDQITSFTGTPVILETKLVLPRGMVYARPARNPFLGKLIPGDTFEGAPMTKHPGAPLISFDTKKLKLSYLDLPREFSRNQLLTLYPNQVQQQFGFSFNYLEDLYTYKNKKQFISHAGILQPDAPIVLEKWEKPAHLFSRSIWKKDDRIEVCNTWGYPYGTVGRLIMGNRYCTGTLISPHHVLTSGHCVYNPELNAWVKHEGFILSFRNGTCANPEYQYQMFKVKQLWTSTGWANTGYSTEDWGIIELDTPSTNLTWMSISWYPRPTRRSGYFNLNAYARDHEPNTMWTSFGAVHTTYEDVLSAKMDTMGGNDGGLVYGYFSNKNTRVGYGILSGSSTRYLTGTGSRKTDEGVGWASITRISKLRFHLICEIMHFSLPKEQWVC